MDIERVPSEKRLRIAVLADFDGPHARSWVRWFINRGHDVHVISFYPPVQPVVGATMHALRPSRAPSTTVDAARTARASTTRGRFGGTLRLAHGVRYRLAGLRRTLDEIKPDVFHGHFLVEHGFYGALAGVHPYVVTAWGSDVLVEPQRDPLSKLITRWTLGRADLVTSNNAYMAERITALGTPSAKVHVITLGAERYDLERAADSVNRKPPSEQGAPLIVSTRAQEPLYNINEIIEAFRTVAAKRPDARLVIAHTGSMTARLRAQAEPLGAAVEFTGFLGREALRDLLARATVFVSVPSSDATSVGLLQAMAAGAFPVVSDLPTQRELIDGGVNGFRVPLHQPDVLAARIDDAIADTDLRPRAAEANLRIVEERGL
ncbi:MAG TPA: glycosyltransferase, partial [Dehalococcoidia bacterium]